jgi:hypothetical protein
MACRNPMLEAVAALGKELGVEPLDLEARVRGECVAQVTELVARFGLGEVVFALGVVEGDLADAAHAAEVGA